MISPNFPPATLVVANGGINTDPNGRDVIDLAGMRASIAYVDLDPAICWTPWSSTTICGCCRSAIWRSEKAISSRSAASGKASVHGASTPRWLAPPEASRPFFCLPRPRSTGASEAILAASPWITRERYSRASRPGRSRRLLGCGGAALSWCNQPTWRCAGWPPDVGTADHADQRARCGRCGARRATRHRLECRNPHL